MGSHPGVAAAVGHPSLPGTGRVSQWWVPPSCSLFRPDESLQVLRSPWTAVWVKICSSWAGLLLYLWTLVAPLVLRDRDFS